MVTRSEKPTKAQASGAQRRTRPEGARHTDRAATEHSSSLARSALAFAAQCHAGQRRGSNGAAFIEHPLEVARLLRDAGASEVLVAAGLLHDVVEDTHVSAVELTARFGADVARLVSAVSDDACIGSYRQRKQVLCEQVRSAGGDAALLFAAEKISQVRELPDQIRRDMARFGATARDSRARHRLQRYHEMRLEHYHHSLQMLQSVAPRHPLVKQLAHELDTCLIAIGRDATGGGT